MKRLHALSAEVVYLSLDPARPDRFREPLTLEHAAVTAAFLRAAEAALRGRQGRAECYATSTHPRAGTLALTAAPRHVRFWLDGREDITLTWPAARHLTQDLLALTVHLTPPPATATWTPQVTRDGSALRVTSGTAALTTSGSSLEAAAAFLTGGGTWLPPRTHLTVPGLSVWYAEPTPGEDVDDLDRLDHQALWVSSVDAPHVGQALLAAPTIFTPSGVTP